MNPSSQPPLDYLNQIAPSAPKRGLFQLNIRSIIIIGVTLIVLVAGASGLSGLMNTNQKKPWMQLSARLTATQDVVTGATGKIKNSQLKSTNSDLKLTLSNTIRDVETPLTNLGISSDKLPKDILSSESSEKMVERLEDARLNAKYDSTYAREMTYQLGTLLALLQQQYQASSKTETKEFLKTAYDSLEPIHKKIAEFSASNE